MDESTWASFFVFNLFFERTLLIVQDKYFRGRLIKGVTRENESPFFPEGKLGAASSFVKFEDPTEGKAHVKDGFSYND